MSNSISNTNLITFSLFLIILLGILSHNTYNSFSVLNVNYIGFLNTLKNIIGLFDFTTNVIGDTIEDTANIVGGTIKGTANIIGDTIEGTANIVGDTIEGTANIVGETIKGNVNIVNEALHEVSETIDNIGKKKEVFNIDLNGFDYEEANEVCNALDSELATYDQLLQAHKDGAEWCNYGWSANQMALYPTQQKTWNKLQKKKNKNKCGKPGLNGGYFQDTSLKLGVNCYGYKPNPHKEQIVYFNKGSTKQTTTTLDNEFVIDRNTIQVRPFNNSKWSKYSFKKSSYIINPSNYNIDKQIIVSSTIKEENKDPNTYMS